MSNAMRLGKRTLAGVAAGALALGFLSVAGAASSSAAPKAKPKAGTVAATVYAVRSSGTGASAISLPAATMTWPKGYGTLTTGTATTIVDLQSAPSASAKMYYGTDDTVTLNNDDSLSGVTNTPVTADDSIWDFRVDTAGTYAGRVYNGTDTVTFSFATAGTPTSMTLTPATQTVLVGGTADLTVTLLDSAGKATQPQTVDSVALTRSPTDDTLVAIDTLSPAITGLSATELSLGAADFSLSTSLTVAGTTTVTATPAGTLGAGGVTAQSATVVKSGTVASNTVRNLTVTTPSNAANFGTSVASRSAQVPVPSTNITVTVDDTTAASAGNALRFSVYGPAGSVINGVPATLGDPLFIDVTTDAAKQAKINLTLSGTALNATSQITVTQVNVRDLAVSPGAVMTITQTTPAVQPANVVPSPTTVLAKVGASTNVTVQVDDSFGVDQAGWTVRAYRSPTLNATSGGTLLSTTTTNASGSATVTVSPLSTTLNNGVETYYYTATPPVGSGDVTAALLTTITYTTSGNITSMSVNANTGTDFTNSLPTITSAPVVFVPDDTAAIVYGLSAGAVTLSTGVNSVDPSGMYTTFQVTTTPANDVTVTVTEASGLQLSTTAPGATTAWNSGKSSVTIAGTGTPAVYVWGTKTGTHDVIFTSGGIALTGKVKVSNRAQDAYNIAVSPASQTLAAGGFGNVTATVTDYWGNPVTTTADALTATATGQVLLGGYLSTGRFTTNASGQAVITVIAATDAGTGTIAVTPTTLGAPPAWAAGYTKPTTFTTAPVTSAAATVTVSGTPTTQSIAIVGSRGTADVSLPSDETCRSYAEGPPPRALPMGCITVDGVSTGFDEGSAMTPEYRFPGQTSYTAGIDVTTNADGEFNWYRKTGKKIYVRFMSGDVVSSRVIIPAK